MLGIRSATSAAHVEGRWRFAVPLGLVLCRCGRIVHLGEEDVASVGKRLRTCDIPQAMRPVGSFGAFSIADSVAGSGNLARIVIFVAGERSSSMWCSLPGHWIVWSAQGSGSATGTEALRDRALMAWSAGGEMSPTIGQVAGARRAGRGAGREGGTDMRP
jgi:hypothetical protein